MDSIAIGSATAEAYSRDFSMMTNGEWEALAVVMIAGQCVELPEEVRAHIEDCYHKVARKKYLTQV